MGSVVVTPAAAAGGAAIFVTMAGFAVATAVAVAVVIMAVVVVPEGVPLKLVGWVGFGDHDSPLVPVSCGCSGWATLGCITSERCFCCCGSTTGGGERPPPPLLPPSSPPPAAAFTEEDLFGIGRFTINGEKSWEEVEG